MNAASFSLGTVFGISLAGVGWGCREYTITGRQEFLAPTILSGCVLLITVLLMVPHFDKSYARNAGARFAIGFLILLTIFVGSDLVFVRNDILIYYDQMNRLYMINAARAAIGAALLTWPGYGRF